MDNAYAPEAHYATLLTQTEVDPANPAFPNPIKFIGPVYAQDMAERLASEHGWSIARDGAHFRWTVPSPRPKRILELEIIWPRMEKGVIVICAGGGGIPVVAQEDGSMVGVEAVIDKDHVSALLTRALEADVFMMLTDVKGVYQDWGTPQQKLIRHGTVETMRQFSFPAGSMGPKVEAACEFAEARHGFAAMGRLSETVGLLKGSCGTRITLNGEVPPRLVD